MANRQDTIGYGVALRNPPLQQLDGSDIRARLSRYGELGVPAVVSTKQGLVDEGSYYVCTNPVPSTVLAYGNAGSQASFSDTVPFLQIVNFGNFGDSSAKRVFPDYLKVIQIGGTAPASTTSVQLAAVLDNQVRLSTSGTPAVHTPYNTNQDLGAAKSGAQVIVYTGAVAAIPVRSGSARLVGRAQLKGGPTLVLDEYSVTFGINDAQGAGGYLTTVAAYSARMPPIALGPNSSLTFHLWMPGAAPNAFSYEYELGYWVR